jgi:DNA-directed RNA polymerase subunit RPC12/RpoP
MRFEYEELKDDSGHPVYRVRISAGWGYDVLGVVRQASKSRIPGQPLRWTAALAVEPDPRKWNKKATQGGFHERDHASMWLLGVGDAITSPHKAAAARAVRDWEYEQSTGPDKCPACGKLVISNYNTHPQIDSSAGIPSRDGRDEIDCQNCEVKVFRERGELPYKQKHPWQLVTQP